MRTRLWIAATSVSFLAAPAFALAMSNNGALPQVQAAGSPRTAARRSAGGAPYPLSLADAIPAAERALATPAVRVVGVSPDVATALLAHVDTGAYVWQTGELTLLGADAAWAGGAALAGVAPAVGRAAESRGFEDLGLQTIDAFLADLGARFPGLAEGAWGHYLIKVPSQVRRAAPAVGAPAVAGPLSGGTVLSEDFETVPWTRWLPSDNMGGQYGWAQTTCAAHAGTHSADAVRGGSVGSTLSCSASYPSGLEAWLDDTQCENFQGAGAAWLDFYLDLDSQMNSDYFGVYYPDNSQSYYGALFSGSTGGWVHLTFDLKHWYKLGDLSASACNKVSLLFESDQSGDLGVGARVDDLRIQTGSTTGLSCSATATPDSGPAPLTVSFTGTAGGTSGSQTYAWTFGDGATASTQNATHVYASPGSYTARFRVSEGSQTCYSFLAVTATTGGGGTQPQAGTYTGTTTQGKPVSFDVDGNGNISRWAMGFACGGTSGDLTITGTCTVSNGSFSCGSASCPAAGVAVKYAGAFGTASSASGTVDLGVRPDPMMSCCSTSGVGWSATLQGGAPLTATVGADKTSGQAPLTVQFQGGAGGGTPPYSYSWSFGDGSAGSTDASPSHTFTAAGTYQVTLTVHDAASAAANASTSITATAPAMAYRYLVPAVAHNPGVGGVLWRTNVGVVNASGAQASLTVTYRGAAGTNSRSTTLPAGATVEWANVMEALFGYAPSSPVSGCLEIVSDAPLSVAARTFTQGATGTFGQFYPALTEGDALTSGEVGVLPLLKKNGVFRTNIGAINLGASPCTVVVTLHDDAGNPVGNPTTFTLDPGTWQQVTDIFTASGAGQHEVAYATAELQTAGGEAWLYASVIDGGSGDPTTVPVITP